MIKILIVGAGASGLVAANQLIAKFKDVTILEARNRIGGRMHTITDGQFSRPVEEGAEFVHGDLSVTRDFVKNANQSLIPVRGRFYRYKDGKLMTESSFVDREGKLNK